MNESPVPPPAVRSESEDLRRRCLQLRQLSRDVQTLLRAEADLEAAIRECRDALAEVRRKLRWQEAVRSHLVH